MSTQHIIDTIPADILSPGNRLQLRRFVPEDFAAYAEYHTSASVYTYLYQAPPSGDVLRNNFDAAVHCNYEHGGDILYLAVVRKEDAALLGEVLLKYTDASALQGEVGYIFNPRYSGAGYATEAATAMVTAGFTVFGMHRIFARLDTKNAGSIGVVERLGFRREAHFIQNDRFNGIWGDEYVYAMLAEDWATRMRSTT